METARRRHGRELAGLKSRLYTFVGYFRKHRQSCQFDDAEFRRLAPAYRNTIVINRDNREFHERDGLIGIIELAGLPMFPEMPYKRL